MYIFFVHEKFKLSLIVFQLFIVILSEKEFFELSFIFTSIKKLFNQFKIIMVNFNKDTERVNVKGKFYLK